jgi:hypothetical protein
MIILVADQIISVLSVSDPFSFQFCLDGVRDDRPHLIFTKSVRVHPSLHGCRFLHVNCDAVESAIEGQHVSSDRCEERREAKKIHACRFLLLEINFLSMDVFYLAFYFI